jgi:holo-[acyl-carrier protein] synthase
LSWQDCEILIGERGKPYLELSGTVAAEAKRQGITNWHLSLSHDGNIATAFVIAEKQ